MPLLAASIFLAAGLYGEYLFFRAGTKFSLYAAIFVAAIASGAGWLYFGIVHPYTTTQIYPNHDWLGIYCLAAFGLLNLILFVRRYSKTVTEKGTKFPAGGGLIAIGIVASLYVVGVTADHYWFFRGNATGVGSAEGVGAKDVQCDMPLIIRIEADGAHYRCPTNMLFGDLFNQPLAPWPTYRAGKSVQLKEAIAHLEEEAKRNTEGAKITAVPLTPGANLQQDAKPQ